MSIVQGASESSTTTPQRSLNKQYVLDEDEYTAALSHIIARDFFPSLVHLDATNDYLDAVQSKNPHLIQASVKRLQELSDTPQASSSRRPTSFDTPSRTPWATGPSDTPLRTPRTEWGVEEPSQTKPKFDTSLSLDEFQARYTSEDNSSFTQILDAENQQRKERYGWAWDAQKRVEASRAIMLEGRERMLLEAAPQNGVREKFRIEIPTPAGLLTDGKGDEAKEGPPEESEKARGKKRKLEDEAESGRDSGLSKSSSTALTVMESDKDVDVMAPRKDVRSAGVDGWKFKARNALMFAPDADESPYHQSPSLKEPDKHPKVITHGNTRLAEQDQSGAVSRSISAPPSPTRSRINAAIEGTPYPTKTEEKGFNFVPILPSPNPAELGPKAMKQLMTTGTLMATPRVIQSDDIAESITADSPFRIAEVSRRETISRQLSNKASKSLKEKAELMGLRTPGIVGKTLRTPGGSSSVRRDMPPPSWTPRADAPGNLTPAAKRLLERTTFGSAAASRRAEAMEKGAAWDAGKGRGQEPNQIRWTPTPNAGR